MRSIRSVSLLLAAGGACATLASAGEYSNTLGVPGLSGSYAAAFTNYDDGTGDALYATGSFSIPGVSGGSNIARWDGSSWTGVGGGLINQYSNTVTVFGGDLIAAGYFDSAAGVEGTAKLARFDGAAWHSMDAQLESFLSSIWDLTSYDDGTGVQLIVAGNYVGIGGNAGLDHIAKWDGTQYTALGGTIGGAVPLIVLDVLATDALGSSDLYAGGRFLTVNGVPAKNIARWDGAQWSALGEGISRTSGFAQVFHMTTWDDGSGEALYVGGSFNLAGGNPVANIARWDGKAWTALGAGLDSGVQELVVFDDGSGEALYALGNFTNSGTRPMSHVAKWDGANWNAVGEGADANVFGGYVYDAGEGEALVMGGSFANAGGMSANRVASYLADAPCPVDLNSDGDLNFFDISEFLSLFGAGDLSVDYDDSGDLNFFDVSAFLSAFGAGCP